MTTLWVTVIDPTDIAERLNTPSLFPNPANDHITINANGLRKVVVTDLYGKEIITLPANQDELRLDLSPLKPGIYLVTSVTDHDSSTQKIVKQ